MDISIAFESWQPWQYSRPIIQMKQIFEKEDLAMEVDIFHGLRASYAYAKLMSYNSYVMYIVSFSNYIFLGYKYA